MTEEGVQMRGEEELTTQTWTTCVQLVGCMTGQQRSRGAAAVVFLLLLLLLLLPLVSKRAGGLAV